MNFNAGRENMPGTFRNTYINALGGGASGSTSAQSQSAENIMETVSRLEIIANQMQKSMEEKRAGDIDKLLSKFLSSNLCY